MKIKMESNENGRSMVEMLGVLAIIGVLSAGALSGYSKAMMQHKINRLKDQVTKMVFNVQTLYQNNAAYDYRTTRLTNEQLQTLLLLPEMNVNGTCRHALNGKCLLTTNSTQNFYVKIVIHDLSKKACIELSQLDFHQIPVKIYIGRNNEAGNGGTGSNSALLKEFTDTNPITLKTARRLCTGEQNSMIYYFE